jgi:hypothetical protein
MQFSVDLHRVNAVWGQGAGRLVNPMPAECRRYSCPGSPNVGTRFQH